ncbi:MAG: ribosome biogenesis GTP-binding protein YihA/YsxC [Lachnospiraceae bacterium]|nr:ribosome biogenesis GTP-binding protein YihA/YsxC [Lachnospiraceae bacterium]
MFKIRNVNLETVCGISSRLPENGRAELAFAGKSNVGKSTLINALMNRKALARTSSQPGKTQTINYYRVNEGSPDEDAYLPEPFAPDCYLVDLPGYGYASASVEVKAKWGRMIENYLKQSRMLKTVFLLVDIRHAPSANDRLMYEWIVERGMQPVIIATKKDKLKKAQIPKALKTIREGLGLLPGSRMVSFSGMTKEGADEIWGIIRECALGTGPEGE